jgi:hypothetical protein
MRRLSARNITGATELSRGIPGNQFTNGDPHRWRRGMGEEIPKSHNGRNCYAVDEMCGN